MVIMAASITATRFPCFLSRSVLVVVVVVVATVMHSLILVCLVGILVL
jgi:hypothetical protein